MNIASALSRPVSLNHGTGYNVPPSSGFDRPAPPPSPCRTCSDPFAFSAIRRRMISLAFPYYYRRSCQQALQPLSPFAFSTVCADDFFREWTAASGTCCLSHDVGKGNGKEEKDRRFPTRGTAPCPIDLDHGVFRRIPSHSIRSRSS